MPSTVPASTRSKGLHDRASRTEFLLRTASALPPLPPSVLGSRIGCRMVLLQISLIAGRSTRLCFCILHPLNSSSARLAPCINLVVNSRTVSPTMVFELDSSCFGLQTLPPVGKGEVMLLGILRKISPANSEATWSQSIQESTAGVLWGKKSDR